MFSSDFIVRNSIDLSNPLVCGVYFLINRHSEVLYIGSSSDVYQRLNAHKRNKRLVFNRIYIIPFEDENLMKIEETKYTSVKMERIIINLQMATK